MTYEEIHSLFTYDPEGFLIWTSKVNNQFAGRRAGYLNANGYWYIEMKVSKGKSFRAHRLIWLWHKGEMPKGSLDHINRVKTDNRIENLREATPTQQNANKAIDPRSKQKYKGVEKQGNRYRAEIRAKGVRYKLGYFKTPEEAHIAYCNKAKELHGDFACMS